MKLWSVTSAIALLFILLAASSLQAQRQPKELRNGTASSAEIVSFTKSTSFPLALQIINEMSKVFTGKIIIDPEKRQFAVGIDVQRQHWRNALEMVLRVNHLWYEEHEEYFKIVPFGEQKAEVIDPVLRNAKEKYENREVVISAVFFEADMSKFRQIGMSWLFSRTTNDLTVDAQSAAANEVSGLFQLDLTPDLSFGDLTATLKALETDDVGEVVSSPSITVQSGENGRIQVGSDISVVLQDFAGNSVTQFFSTGSIIKVKPDVIFYDSTYFINLELDIERSNSITGDGGLEIKKSAAQTSVLLIDGEETLIGGLYVNEDREKRAGVPFLKDLPWYVFGLRYLFGLETRTIIKKELIILIKAQLLPTVKERLELKKRGNHDRMLLQERIKGKIRMEDYQRQIEAKLRRKK